MTTVSKIVVIVWWAVSLIAAYILGLYTVYRHELHSGISETQYRVQSLQLLSEIRDSNRDIFSVLVQ